MLQQIKDRIAQIGCLSIMFGNRDIEHQTERLSELVSEAETSISDMQAALNDSHRQCAELAGKVACLNERLDMWMQRARSREDEDGYPVDITSRHIGIRVCPDRDIECGTRESSWCDACPNRSESPLHEIHRAYGVEHVDTGVNDHD